MARKAAVNNKRATIQNGMVQLRREPTQDRSAERVERILAETERLIEEDGFDSIAIAEVARRAGVNIATFYQFFPNRHALIRRIAERHIAIIRELVDGRIAHLANQGGDEELVNELVEATYDYLRRTPSYVEVWSGMQGDKALKALDIEDTIHTANALAVVLRRRKSLLSDVRARRIALNLVLMASNVFRFASHCSPAEGRALVDECKRSLLQYLLSVE
jgi:AcrR family transcriptional regulator